MSDAKIKRYAFKIPLLFEGDRGSGKTFDAREFAKSSKLKCLEIAGNESLESFDFLGHVVQSEHGMIWKDGKLSQAFRLAASGEKVVLIIDEMLRIPQRHLSVLLSALSPDSDGNYRLQTGRMTSVRDGVGNEEEIIAPIGNIAIFATTNVGPEFAIDELDPAVAERFIIVRKDTEMSQLTKILQKKAEQKSFNRLIAVKLVELFNKTQRMVKTGTLNRHATTRTLARAIDYAEDEDDVKQILKDQVLLWADRDSAGAPVGQQTEMLEKTIEELFRDLPKPKAPEAVPGSGGERAKAKAAAKAEATAIAELAGAAAGWGTEVDMAYGKSSKSAAKRILTMFEGMQSAVDSKDPAVIEITYRALCGTCAAEGLASGGPTQKLLGLLRDGAARYSKGSFGPAGSAAPASALPSTGAGRLACLPSSGSSFAPEDLDSFESLRGKKVVLQGEFADISAIYSALESAGAVFGTNLTSATDLAIIGGGLYPSRLAKIEETCERNGIARAGEDWFREAREACEPKKKAKL